MTQQQAERLAEILHKRGRWLKMLLKYEKAIARKARAETMVMVSPKDENAEEFAKAMYWVTGRRASILMAAIVPTEG